MIKIKRNVKKGERKKLGIRRSSKSKERAWAAKFCSKSESLRKWLLATKWFRSRPSSSVKIFAAAKRPHGTRVPFCNQVHLFRSCEMAVNFPRLEIHRFAAEVPFWRVFHSYRTTLWHTSAILKPCTLISQLQNGCEFLHALKCFSAHTMSWNVAAAPLLDTFRSTFRSPFHVYHISFQILGSQESNASNGAQFGVETKKL